MMVVSVGVHTKRDCLIRSIPLLDAEYLLLDLLAVHLPFVVSLAQLVVDL